MKFICCRYLILPCYLLTFSYDTIHALDAILQRIELNTVNEKYIRNVTAAVTTYSRRQKPVLNIISTSLYTWDNNVTISLIYEEFINNQYRSSFVGFRYQLCDFLNSPLINIKKLYGIQCPVPPGQYRFMNMTVQWQSLPNMFPFKKGRVSYEFSVDSVREVIVNGYLYVAFKY